MSRFPEERLLRAGLGLCGLVSATIVVLIVAFVCREAWPAWRDIGPGAFFGDDGWQPLAPPGDQRYGIAAMVLASAAVALGAVAVAVPLGWAAALCCECYAPAAVARALRAVIDLFAGIPSVVFGLWGLVAVVPVIRAVAPPGPSLLAGVMILALMIVPTVAATACSALRAVPRPLIAGAAALGLSRARTLSAVVMPAARTGLLTGVVLALGRALGETMAVLMVCGNVVRVPGSPFDPVRTLTANIALEMGFALGPHRSALFVCGLVLLGLVVAVVTAAGALDRGARRD